MRLLAYIVLQGQYDLVFDHFDMLSAFEISEMALDFFNLGPGTHISGPVGVPNDFYGSQNLSLVPEIICKLKIIFNYPFRQNRTRRGQKIITILGLV